MSLGTESNAAAGGSEYKELSFCVGSDEVGSVLGSLLDVEGKGTLDISISLNTAAHRFHINKITLTEQ